MKAKRVIQPRLAVFNLIKELEKDLTNYKRSAKVNQYVLKEKQELINSLVTIADNMIMINQYAYLMRLINLIEVLKKEDKQINGYLVKINLTELPSNVAHININYYEE